MSRIIPYQPVLLRLLHSAIALLVFGSLITGFMVYDRYDKRLGTLNLPIIPNTQGIHGTIALTFLLLLPIFAIYCFHIGDRRLIQKESLKQLQEVGKPIWWISLQRFANSLLLLGSTFAVITGRMMQEEWLPSKEFDHAWYSGHLIAWLLMIVSIAIHLLMSAKVGGLPLLLSIYNWKIRPEDMPKFWLRGFKIKPSTTFLFIFEVLVIGGIAIAFLLPAVFPAS
ncbi:cytochrome b/b6 domain-containing protein [Pseudanabaena sp. FACHB-1998]|uniref:cytochrome b/b6 domain-containing protein n=1 Tax=Pseudanabaena sp. FACHB-1998 TaxID=2692858 RepID=UPI0016802AC3|nr:cytochrome b/b6 domain-containing protein [Pseudanabaena sp. FACHB-1998]MBD2178387.1 cytochrome b/b6 domain-containing protein [Pseudanabaena sp. FACHB-1998]